MRLTTKCIFALLIFVISFSAKSLQAVDLEPVMYTAEQPGSGMTSDFDSRALSIVAGHGLLVPDDQDPSDTTLLGHAPAYSIFLGAIYFLKGRNFFTVQLVQNAINSVSPVLIFLIAGNLISWRVGVASGFLAAVSHHLSYYSNLILSDSLCALPILIGVYLLVKALLSRNRSLWPYALTGLMIGLSAWIRPNPMLMGLTFAVLLAVIFARRKRFLLQATGLAAASFLAVAPITIRNYLIYHEFVPIQIGVGLSLWEGLGKASDGRFGPTSDDEMLRQEVALYDEPRYRLSWATPDGIKRDRARVGRSFDVILEHPIWYVGSLFGRIVEMFKYSADAPLVFRSTDTRLKDAIGESRFQSQTSQGLNEWSEQQIETIGRSALVVGKVISWMRPPARALQRVTKETALSFILVGLAILSAGSWRRTLFILMVPLYYFLFQSVMHTEFRYTLPMRYFLFVFAAVVWTLLLTVALTGLRDGFFRVMRKRANPDLG